MLMTTCAGALRWAAAIAVTAGLSVAGGCRPHEARADHHAGEVAGDLTIFHAGSLTVPVRELSALFTEKYPNTRVKTEAAGSRQCARRITELGRPCDVMMSADYKVVESLLVPHRARFNIRFATNELAIAFTGRSRYGQTITSENWPEVLLRPDVAVGRSEPNSDPCGYRTLLAFQLAEKAYKIAGLDARLRQKPAHIRPKETDLLALLEMGEIDYLFIYRSVARQHGLRMIVLPDEMNLKSPEMADLYATATVRLSGKQPGTWITRKGEPVVYSVTIPLDAPNPSAAEAWVALLLSPTGQALMERNGQPALRPAIAGGFDDLPPRLKPLCAPATDDEKEQP